MAHNVGHQQVYLRDGIYIGLGDVIEISVTILMKIFLRYQLISQSNHVYINRNCINSNFLGILCLDNNILENREYEHVIMIPFK